MTRTVDLKSTFAQGILHAVQARIPALSIGPQFSTEELCGEDLWNELTNGEKKQAGKVITAAAAAGALPLRDEGKDSANHHHFTRT